MCALFVLLVAAGGCGTRATPPTVSGDATAPPPGTHDDFAKSPNSATIRCNFGPRTTLEVVDFRSKPHCIELYARLSKCCSTTTLVKTYVFGLLLPSCEAPLPSDADCRRLLDEEGRVARECAYLQKQPTCNVTPLGCGGVGAGGGGRKCDFKTSCQDAPGGAFIFECEGAGSDTRCVCTREYSGETFAVTTQLPVCDAPNIGVLFFHANALCGWTLPSPFY
ncbi:MAG: hypothetical protein KC503_11365 [Myxococcales bacterium]|nr:hypothetical protein [Myxococcales bacterium]